MPLRPHALALAVAVAALDGWAATDGGLLCLDRSFADGGLFVRDVGGVGNLGFTAQGLSLQDDGRLVLGGRAGVSPRFDFVTLRLLDDGSLDPTFGDGGVAAFDLGGFDQYLETVEVQPDGKIMIAGSLDEVLLPDGGTVISTAVAQLLPDGRLDPAFGALGVLHPRYGAGEQLVNGQARLPDGRHRLAGQCQPFGSPGAINLCVIGLLADGSPDLAFGDGGLVELDIDGSDDFGGVLALDAQGRLLVPSTSYNPNLASASAGFNFGLARLLPSGDFDPTFTNDAGAPGRVTTDFFGKRDSCNVVLVQSDGLIVCAGDADSADGGMRFALARYLPSGALDPSFGDAGGTIAFDFGGAQGIRALTTLPDGTLVAGGYATGLAGDQDFLVAFLGPTGTLDGRYGNGGIIRADVSGGRDDAVHTLRVDASERLLLFGEAGGAAGNDFALMRLTACTPPDAGVPDAGVPDAGVPDAGVPDAGVPDAGVPDAGVPDAGVPDLEPGRFGVGCACDATALGPWLLVIFALRGGRYRRPGRA